MPVTRGFKGKRRNGGSEDLPRLFDRFWQGDGAARVGSGLGLTIAKGTIEAHGGRIWAQRALGNGTTFRFTFPVGDGS